MTASVSKRLPIAGAALLVCAAPWSASDPRPARATVELQIGERIEDLPCTGVDPATGWLSDLADREAVVVAGLDPAAADADARAGELAALERELSSRGVAFLFVDFGADARFAAALRARSAEEAFLLDPWRRLRYRGGLAGLREAVAAVLAGGRVAEEVSEAPGRALEPAPPPAPVAVRPPPTWHGEISRIVQAKCQDCHRKRGGAPFPLLELDDVAGRETMVRKVVADRVMPPWFASHDSVPFKTDTRLSAGERLALLRWIQEDCPAGDPAQAPPPRSWPDGWLIGKPDITFRSNRDLQIPSSGQLDYFDSEVDWEVDRNLWVQGVQVLPRAIDVVHHLAVLVWDPDRRRWQLFDGYLPGKAPTIYPPGVAKLLKKGSRFRFSIHYTPNGVFQTDRITVGLLEAKEPPEFKVSGMYVKATGFVVPAQAKAHEIVAEGTMKQGGSILRLIPHMHQRGRSALVDFILPDGTTLRPLTVERWHPDWQFAYELAEPIPVPDGTQVRVTCIFDNTADNPFNPDPRQNVIFGPQFFQEMAESYVEWITPRRAARDGGQEADDDAGGEESGGGR